MENKPWFKVAVAISFVIGNALVYLFAKPTAAMLVYLMEIADVLVVLALAVSWLLFKEEKKDASSSSGGSG